MEIVFDSFCGGYFGTSFYYYILKDSDFYIFKAGMSEDGDVIDIDDGELIVSIKSEREYYEFINNLKNKISNWDKSYVNEYIMDGIQWHINFILDNDNYSGSNEFPSNFDYVMDYLDLYFLN